MLDKKRNIAIILSILCLLIILPPLMYGYIYPTGGDASAAHLDVIKNITLTHPIPREYLYDGQWIVGYPLVVLKTLFHIPLTVSFLWFNYLALIGIVLSFYYVFSKMFNRLAGIMASVGMFIINPFVALFLAGEIFDIMALGIFIWALYFGVRAWTKRHWWLAVVSLLLFVLFLSFHANMSLLHQAIQGATPVSAITIMDILHYAAAVVICGIAVGAVMIYRKKLPKERLKDNNLMSICLGATGILLVIASAPTFKLLVVPSRLLLDGVIIVYLLVVSAVSLQVESKKQADVMVAGIALIASLFWLPLWFTYFSAIKPVDKQAIEFVNSLNGGQFYGNEYVAPWVYQPYVNKTYIPDSNIYIRRSKPMTGKTDPTSEWWWNPQGLDVKPKADMKVLAKFEGRGIEIYVEGY